jgi:hypothetical protein
MGRNDLLSSAGLAFPIHIFDLHTAYLAASNVLLPYDLDEEKKRKKPRKRLADACRAYGIEGWENIDKETIAEDIAASRWHLYGQDGVFDYCEEDVKKSAELLRAMLLRGRNVLPIPDTDRILHWSNYSAKVIALIQAKGMPIDVALWNLVQENKKAVVRELLLQLDPSHGNDDPIYNEDGEWSYARFERWLINVGVMAWPRLESGQLDIDGDAFRSMYHIPGIEGLHALKDSLRVITGANLPIARDGRNRPSLFPFGTATGRNAHRKSLPASHLVRHGRAVVSARAQPPSAHRQRHHRAPPASVSAFLVLARERGANSHAGTPHREHFRMAVTSHRQPKSAHAL